MRLSWRHVCHVCRAPLDPRVFTAGKENKRSLFETINIYAHCSRITMNNTIRSSVD